MTTLDNDTFEQLAFANTEQWDNRTLGADPAFAKKASRSPKMRQALNAKTQVSKEKTQLISIRLPISLIDDLKEIGASENLGYQTLAKNVLQRFVDAENRMRYNKLLSEKRKLQQELDAMRAELQQLKQA